MSFPPKWHTAIAEQPLFEMSLSHFCGAGSGLLTVNTILFIFTEFEDKSVKSSASETKIHKSTHKFGVNGSHWEKAIDDCLLNLRVINRIRYKINI